jgi:hypothetical protein
MTIWFAGWHMPRYLPEITPLRTEDWGVAQAFLVDELNDIIEDPDESQWVTDEARIAKAGILGAPIGSEIQGEHCGKYVYWLVKVIC